MNSPSTSYALDSHAVSLRRINKRFVSTGVNGDRLQSYDALVNVELTIKPGTIIGLMGPSGAGKSTLGKIAAGLLRPDSGTVTLGQTDLYHASRHTSRNLRSLLRYVPQNPDSVVLPDMTVHQALSEASSVSRLRSEEQTQWSDELINSQLFDTAWLPRRITKLSLGERRRVVNIRALITCPAFAVFDEPFNGLDANSLSPLLKLFKTYVNRFNACLLIIAHDHESLSDVCDAVFSLSDGVLQAETMQKRIPSENAPRS